MDPSEVISVKLEMDLGEEHGLIAENETVIVSPSACSQNNALETDPLVEDAPYKCGQCSYAGSHIAHLKTHMKTHTAPLFHSCKSCNFTSPIRKYVKIHEEQLHQTSKYICGDCGFSRPTKEGIKYHIERSHLKRSKYWSSRRVKKARL